MSQNVVNSYRHVASCTQEYRDNGASTGTGWGTNTDTIWVVPTSATIAEGDKIEKIGQWINDTYDQPYGNGVKFVAYSDSGGSPSAFICMTITETSMSGTGWKELDVVDTSTGAADPHVVTAGEAGTLHIGNWANGSMRPYFDIGQPAQQSTEQTFNASNLAAGEPTSTWNQGTTHTAQPMTRATVCVY